MLLILSMDIKGKAEIEQAFESYGFKPYNVAVTTDPGSGDVPYVHIETYGMQPGHVLSALAIAGLMRAAKVTGPRLVLEDWAFITPSVMGRVDGFLFEDRNSPSSPNRDR